MSLCPLSPKPRPHPSMRIEWPNIFALVLAIVILTTLIKHHSPLALTLSDVAHIGPGHSQDEKTMGLIVLMVVGACLVAIVRILTRNRHD